MYKTFFATVAILSASVASLQASDPSVEGRVRGIELCPQFICGSARFVGVFTGEVDGSPAFGTWSASVTHDPLPDLGDPPVAVTGGRWQLRLWVMRRFSFRQKRLSGAFETGRLIALPDNFYRVRVPMTVTSGGSGQIKLNLLLDENSIPQPVRGTLKQPRMLPE